MFRRTALSTAIVVAMGASAGSTLAIAEEVEKLEKIQVTGSRISRVDAEGSAPITIITREDIELTGATTVSDVLRGLTENGSDSYNESFTNGFAPGSASVSLRGLGSSRTLVLLNGRRVANFGFAQNINETGVDLNSIPLSAVDRVEVLKDGASAIYGSDAIAGVINVILRKDFEGNEVAVSYGSTNDSDGQKGQLNLVTGKTFGDTNVMVSLDYYNQKDIMMRDRQNMADADQSANGGINWRSSRSIYPRVVLADDTSICNDPTGNGCRFNYNDQLQYIPPSERYGILSSINHDFNESVSGFVELAYARTQTDTVSAPTPHFSPVGSLPLDLPASNPNNPYGQDAQVYSRYADVGQRLNSIDSKTYRFVTGLTGALSFGERDIDWDASVGYSQNKVVNDGRNYIHYQNMLDAIDDGSYNPLTPTSNDQSVIDGFRVSLSREADSKMSFATANASMPVFELPAGDVYLAWGAEYRKESIKDSPDPLIEQRAILGSGGTGAEGDRDIKAFYTEFAIPVHEDVEIQIAGRAEKYSDFGNTFDPKFAFRWQPVDSVVVRGSYSTAFKAPTLPELFGGNSVSYVDLEDTAGCTDDPSDDYKCEAKQYQVVRSGNADLEAEEAETYNIGFVWEPIDSFEIKMDAYKIRNTNLITTRSSQTLIDDRSDAVVRNPDTGRIEYITNQYVNVSQQEIHGLDAEIAYTWDLAAHGTLETRYKTSFIKTYKLGNSNGGVDDLTGTAGSFSGSGPRTKSKLFFVWNKGDFTNTAVVNYTSSYEQPYQFEHKKVDRLYTLDLQVAYTGFENTKLTFGVDNVTDELAPFFDGDSSGIEQSTHSNVGTYIYGKVNYTF